MLLLLACTTPSDTSTPAPDTDETATDTGETDPDPDSAVDTDTAVDTDDVDTAPDTWRSALYPEDWTPAFTDGEGHFLHDFSYAGYHAGEVAIPTAPGASFDVTAYGADPTGVADSTTAIQAAIAAGSAASAAGGGAVVDLPAGTYRVDGLLSVGTSGVVLRGAGSTSTFVYFTKTTGVDYAAHLTFGGAVVQGADHLLEVDGEARSHDVQVADVSGISVGDNVAIGWTISDAFVDEHGMTDTWVSFNGDWKAFFRRTVTAVEPGTSTVTLDVPLRYPAKMRDGASLRVESGYLTECGLESLALSNAADWASAWASTQVHVALFSEVQDCWVRDVVSFASPYPGDARGKHLMSSGIEVLDSRRVTITDSVMEEAEHRGSGGNGYLFEISRSNEVLTVDTIARGGRHNFIQNWDFGTSGCVWLRTTSEGGRSLLADWDPVGFEAYSEFHHSLAMANLIDQSEATDGWQGVNRQGESSGAGHSATQNVWWGLGGGGYLRSLQVGDGYVIGTDGLEVHVDPDEWDWNDSGEGTAPEDWTEGLDEAATLDPPSLYEDQLGRRLGE
ncbi:MAG: glycosyl hydrolase family 28-related protein [Pseudomonadota bacterium]|nr:glycosyl hydrolase family 28-related protein [Pseudomonadota bacterium]